MEFDGRRMNVRAKEKYDQAEETKQASLRARAAGNIAEAERLEKLSDEQYEEGHRLISRAR